MKKIPAYRQNDYLLKADIPYNEQNHARNSLSVSVYIYQELGLPW